MKVVDYSQFKYNEAADLVAAAVADTVTTPPVS